MVVTSIGSFVIVLGTMEYAQQKELYVLSLQSSLVPVWMQSIDSANTNVECLYNEHIILWMYIS